MNIRVTRRGALLGAAAFLWPRSGATKQPVQGTNTATVANALAELETREGGRLGVAAIDTGNGNRLKYRAGELFAMCSTFKFLAAAAILQRVDHGQERLDRWIPYEEGDLLEYAPVSKEHVKDHGMALADVCSAAVEWSDNTAANIMLKILGGPTGFTQFVRSLGDTVTRLDRVEPDLNVVEPPDTRDTSSPAAMARLLSTVLFGQVLTPESRARLQGWMLDCKVGEHRIPAGLPPGWRIAHKTGTWSEETNDVGVIWPPNRAPVVLAVFYAHPTSREGEREHVLRDVGHLVATSF